MEEKERIKNNNKRMMEHTGKTGGEWVRMFNTSGLYPEGSVAFFDAVEAVETAVAEAYKRFKKIEFIAFEKSRKERKKQVSNL
jgi:hypothetical protein